ncbi:MAG: TIGR00730 family Rossman fold protein [Opitutaceae bacterium]|jgi:uncharacterized protein (TIGR00730 family)|nr:TIGR00730 family Rossman fold protein [Opitutaceae bacterium]
MRPLLIALAILLAIRISIHADGPPAAASASAAAASAGNASSRARVSSSFSVCVYCGASDLVDAKYPAAARALGAGLARRGWTLVYGGNDAGLMGAVARGARENGGRVVGVIPKFIRAWNPSYDDYDELLVVTTMAERKLVLQTRSDAFVVLPGGLGTLDEFADTVELRQLALLEKPIILFNQDGYYDAIIAFVEHGIREKFTQESIRAKFSVASTTEELLAQLDAAARARPAPAGGQKRKSSEP